MLHTEGNWICCNWLWSAALFSKRWLCKNPQIKIVCLCVCQRRCGSLCALITEGDPALKSPRSAAKNKDAGGEREKMDEGRERVVRRGKRDIARGRGGQREDGGQTVQVLAKGAYRCVCVC